MTTPRRGAMRRWRGLPVASSFLTSQMQLIWTGLPQSRNGTGQRGSFTRFSGYRRTWSRSASTTPFSNQIVNEFHSVGLGSSCKMPKTPRVTNEKKNLNRLAGEFLVASRLTQRGYMVTLQWG